MIVVFGSINADLVFTLDELPRPGQTLLADGMTVEPGGKGANQAVAAARDRGRVVMAGAVGPDGLAETALAGLRAGGVDLSRVRVADLATGCAAIHTDRAGRNQIVVAAGANRAAGAAAVEDALLGPDTTVITQMECDPVQTAMLIRRARVRGARVIHNLAPAGPMALEVLKLVDVLVTNEDEAAWLGAHIRAETGATHRDGVDHDCDGRAAGLHAALGSTVVRTLGAAGVEWAGPAGAGRLAAGAIDAIDTTAAGDCFVGVLAAALDGGACMTDAIRRANSAAGLACMRRGSQGSLPYADEIDAAIRS